MKEYFERSDIGVSTSGAKR